MQRLFDDNMYRFDTPQRSYWEATADAADIDTGPLAADESCDVAIIGGGYTGLSAALHLARDYDIDVRVLEAGHVGWGASGRNGGFCCPGGTGLDLKHLVRYFGADDTRDYYRAQSEAVELVRRLGEDEGIDFQAVGDGEAIVAHNAGAWRHLQEAHEAARSLGIDSELLTAAETRERYYDAPEQFGATVWRPAFGLHPLRYCRGLAAAASMRGAQLHTQSEVLDWSSNGDGRHRLRTAGGSLTARRVLFATNGFIDEALRAEFRARVMPIVSAIVVTRPLTGDEKAAHAWAGNDTIANSRRILNYYRLLPDNRFLFGGRGDLRGHEPGERRTYAQLERLLGELWPHWRGIDIEYRWHGLILYTASLRPSLGNLDDDPSVYFAYGYHGNGVNNASWSGKQMADWIGRGREPDGLPDIVRGLSRKYPLPFLRRAALGFGIAVARQLDRFG